MSQAREPRLYSELARWWPLFSPPDEYTEEAALYGSLLENATDQTVKTVLELGSGGGNNASHLKGRFDLTLSDVSQAMLTISQELNPECEHVRGDMRTLRLGRIFDAVFVHDAISYITTEEDLGAVMVTIASHCRPGGAVLVTADEIADRFEPSTEHGGSDADDRGIRFLQWSHSPDPSTTSYLVDYAYLIREGHNVTVEHDRHVCGLFPKSTWLDLMDSAQLDVEARTHTFSDGFTSEIFVGTRR
ncbi:MAG: class I SAM-dependent methyltransferase [Actinomycetota bacterium]|nr:class I SAM-dependent methyltransferase [Actinomycetota bacterium]